MMISSRPTVSIPAVLLAASLAALAGCGTTEGVEQEQVYQTQDGVAVVDTFTTVATITAVDSASRKVTLTTPDGKSSTFRAAKGVDVSSLKAGQQIGVQLMDEVALQIRKDGTPASDASVVALAAESDPSGGAIFEGTATQVAVRVTAIDPSSRKVTVEFADGTTKTVKAQRKIDLSGLAVGDTVIVTSAEAMVVALANP